MGYITGILFAIIHNGAFQNDFIDFFRIPVTWYVRFCEWLIFADVDRCRRFIAIVNNKVAVDLVFNASGVKDVLLQLFNKII